MPRGLRCFVEGGIYHVYNRFSSGEPVFADPEEALEFIEFLRYIKQRDGWTVFAWVLMSNHCTSSPYGAERSRSRGDSSIFKVDSASDSTEGEDAPGRFAESLPRETDQ